MGDCRIRILIASSLLGSVDDTSSDTPSLKTVVDRMWSSDTTLREVADETSVMTGEDKNLFSWLESTAAARLWDCTLHPPRDITTQLLENFPETQGPRSQTLHAAGFFPSGIWQVLPEDIAQPTIPKFGVYENEAFSGSISNQQVEWKATATTRTSGERLKPSELLQSVQHRFDNDDEEAAAKEAVKLRHENRQRTAASRQAAQERLQKRIRQLEQTADTNAVSDQVRRMLIKSRATGRKELRAEDRLHFKCYCVHDNGGDDDKQEQREDYRFFSKQDTVGKVVSALMPTECGELLVKKNDDDYRRLPALMRLYEAVEKAYLKDFCTIFARQFDPSTHDSTRSIEEEAEETVSPHDTVMVSSTPTEEKEANSSEVVPDNNEINTTENEGDSVLRIPSLATAIQAWETSHTKKKLSKKPASSATSKVRQMQMKSKAKGDAKRVKLADRFFVELVVLNKENLVQSMGPVFLGRSDKLERLVRDCCGKHQLSSWEMLVPDGANSEVFTKIKDTGMTLQAACERRVLAQFGRLIVRAC